MAPIDMDKVISILFLGIVVFLVLGAVTHLFSGITADAGKENTSDVLDNISNGCLGIAFVIFIALMSVNDKSNSTHPPASTAHIGAPS